MLLTSPDLRTLEIAAAVSQAVRRVEAAVGAPLLHRDQRPLVATGAGRALAERVRALRLDVDRVLDAARAAASLPERLDVRLGLVDDHMRGIRLRLGRVDTGRKQLNGEAGWTAHRPV